MIIRSGWSWYCRIYGVSNMVWDYFYDKVKYYLESIYVDVLLDVLYEMLVIELMNIIGI